MAETESEGSAAARHARYARPLFVATIVTGSFILFLTQPMVARMALPRVGGAPAVWNSAMLVFQVLLLGGYAYAHALGRLRPRLQVGVHVAAFALAALWLPIGLSGAMPAADANPVLWVPLLLLGSIGPLFFVVSAQAPLMQRWFALEERRGDPYPLYAASNLGSFAGLLSYPLLVEPLLTLQQQSWLWTAGYALLALLVIGCGLTVPRTAPAEVLAERSPAPARKRVLHWILLAAVPSGLMLSTTTHLTTDIVAVPLLWALPLGLYLLSFVIAFAERRRAADLVTLIAPLVLLIAGGFAFSPGTNSPVFMATLGISLLFALSVALHGEMYRLRPASDRLTGFYLAMSVGGMLGGLFCAILAPVVFDWSYEHPLLVLAAAALVPQRPLFGDRARLPEWLLALLLVVVWPISYAADGHVWGDPSAAVKFAAIAFVSIVALLFLGRRFAFTACLAALMMAHGGWSTLYQTLQDVRTRSYFGVYTIFTRADGSARILMHGTTLHGVQSLLPGEQSYPTTYYTPESGVGQVMRAADVLYGPAVRIGVVGLGTGTLSCYRKPGQDWTFFEIDPAMVRVARDRSRFTYLSACAPDARIVLGDARLSIAGQPPGSFDILAIDAFSSDSVPTHLLTREALDVYRRALVPDGILLFHISNRYIRLEPVIAAEARAGGWEARLLLYEPDAAAGARNASISSWIALSRSSAKIADMMAASDAGAGWRPLAPRAGFAGWTDDYAPIVPLLKIWEK